MNWFNYKYLTGLTCITFFISCGIPKNFQHALYLQDSVTEAEKNVTASPVIIMPGDRLSINITAINKIAAEDFNISGTGTTQNTSSINNSGYLVDSGGDIQLLQLGVLHVAGLTPDQLSTDLHKKLSNYIVGPVVSVSISNFKINILGEVARAGSITVADGRINIFEAITQAGDLTLYGRRDNILVIRQINGKREFGRLDVSSNHVFESPYFNLRQNDVIYVESDKTKFISNDAFTARNLRNFGIAVTALTTFILILNLFRK